MKLVIFENEVPQRVEPRRKRRRSAKELADRAARNRERLAGARKVRAVSLAETGVGVFAAYRQEAQIRAAEAARREVRSDLFGFRPEWDGREYRGSRPRVPA